MMRGSQITSIKSVQTALKQASSAHAEDFLYLVSSTKIGPFNDTTRKKRNGDIVSRAKAFGTGDLEIPRLRGVMTFPFGTVPTTEELRDILIKDLEETVGSDDQALQYVPQQAEAETNRAAAAELINNVHNKSYCSDRHIAHLASPTLDSMLCEKKDALPNTLFELATSCSVLPSGHLIPLQHQNESFTFSVCMTGSIAWIIWPCTKENLSILRRAYQTFAEDKSLDPKNLNVSGELDGGIACVQQLREVLRIPPFCPIMGLVLESAVIARYSTITCHSFLQLCRNLPLYKAFWKTEIDPERKQFAFTKALIACLTNILAGELDEEIDILKLKYPITEQGPILMSL